MSENTTTLPPSASRYNLLNMEPVRYMRAPKDPIRRNEASRAFEHSLNQLLWLFSGYGFTFNYYEPPSTWRLPNPRYSWKSCVNTQRSGPRSMFYIARRRTPRHLRTLRGLSLLRRGYKEACCAHQTLLKTALKHHIQTPLVAHPLTQSKRTPTINRPTAASWTPDLASSLI